MYKIYADDQLLYAPHLANQGCGVFSPKLTVELNKAGELDFTMPPQNTLYNKLNKLKTIITAYQNEEEIFRGRVLHDEKDFYNQKHTYCEGELAFLLDSKQRPYTKPEATPGDMLKYYISNHNARVDNNKKFEVGYITVSAKDVATETVAVVESGVAEASTTVKATVVKNAQFASYTSGETSDFGTRYMLGASHNGVSPTGYPTNKFNLWMRYSITVPKDCYVLDFTAKYTKVFDSVLADGSSIPMATRKKIVARTLFRYSIGSANSPGSSYHTFAWNTDTQQMTGCVYGDFSAGETIYLWFHYNYASQDLCYVQGVTITSVVGTVYEAGSSGSSGEETEKPWFSNDDYSDTLSEIQDKLISRYGGYLKTRTENGKRYIDWTGESGGEINQTIEFGNNLLDISEHITAENIYTIIIPIGATIYDSEGNAQGKLNISSVNSGKDYIENATAISLFGRIEEKVEWSEVEDASQLKNLRTNTLSKNIEASVTLDIKAIDLYLLNADAERIHVGDLVRVISLPHNLNALFQCTKIVYDMTSPENTEYIFGIPPESITDKQTNGEKQIRSSATVAQTAVGMASSSASAAAQANASAQYVVAQLPSEYVQTSVFEAYKSNIEANYVTQAVFNTLVARVETLEGGTT